LVIVLAALSSDRADWQPMSLAVALGVTMIVADILAVTVRRIRVSAGLMVQVVAMALLGPAPAAAIDSSPRCSTPSSASGRGSRNPSMTGLCSGSWPSGRT
jgi:hypothetical protein